MNTKAIIFDNTVKIYKGRNLITVFEVNNLDGLKEFLSLYSQGKHCSFCINESYSCYGILLYEPADNVFSYYKKYFRGKDRPPAKFRMSDDSLLKSLAFFVKKDRSVSNILIVVILVIIYLIIYYLLH